jgi:uncharacterized protein
MDNAVILSKTRQYVIDTLGSDSAGHDHHHTMRVNRLARYIADKEGADIFVVDLASLLHDIADYKFHDGDEDIGANTAYAFLQELDVEEHICRHVKEIVHGVSFKGADAKQIELSIEGKIVQDADRLDAIGAVGIGRAFAYGGHAKRPMYDPDDKSLNLSKEDYMKKKSHTINHFYEKLLLLKDRLNTDTARQIAEQRHQFTEAFVQQFLDEWDGKDYLE